MNLREVEKITELLDKWAECKEKIDNKFLDDAVDYEKTNSLFVYGYALANCILDLMRCLEEIEVL